MKDRTVKTLLTLIVLALWGLLLRPTLTPIPASAADALREESPPIVVTNTGVYVSTHHGHVFLLDPSTLAVKARAIYTLERGASVPTFLSGR